MHRKIATGFALVMLLAASTTFGASMKHHLNLSLKKGRLAVCQLARDAALPSWASGPADFFTVSRTAEELSIVCPEEVVPSGVKKEGGWRLLKIEGPLAFNLTGILASVAQPLAKAKISIFAISTYDTDYVMVKEEKTEEAIKVLKAAGHKIRVE